MRFMVFDWGFQGLLTQNQELQTVKIYCESV